MPSSGDPKLLAAVREKDIGWISDLDTDILRSEDLLLDENTQRRITALHLAVGLEHLEVVETLLRGGSPVHVRSSDGRLPIEELRFSTGDADEICRLLLLHQQWPVPYDRRILYQLLLNAVHEIRPVSVRRLLDAGAPGLESSTILGHSRSYVTNPLCLWASWERTGGGAGKLRPVDAAHRHAEVGDALLSLQPPFSPALRVALARTIKVGNRPAAEAVIHRGVRLVFDTKEANMISRDPLLAAVEGHYSVERREEFLLLLLGAGYRVEEALQPFWIRRLLSSLLTARGMTPGVARLLFAVVGRLCHTPALWAVVAEDLEAEEEDSVVHPAVVEGLARLQTLDGSSLANLSRDCIRRRLVTSTPEAVGRLCSGYPTAVRRCLLLEDIFSDA